MSFSKTFYTDQVRDQVEEFYENLALDPVFQDIIKQWEWDFEEDETSKKRRKKEKRIDYWDSAWGRLLLDPLTMDPTSSQGLLFRRRFRVPFPLFMEVLLPICRTKNIFDIKDEKKVSNNLSCRICFRLLLI